MADLTDQQKMDKLKGAFEMTCDQIQEQTEQMLDLVPRFDNERRGKILDLHRMKLQEAIDSLNKQLAKF